MSPSIDTIVQELLELDPSLESRRDELKQYLQQIADAKPDTHFSPEFADSLKHRLREKMASPTEATDSIHSFPLLVMWQKFAFGLGGAALGALLVFVVQTQIPDVPTHSPSQETTESMMAQEDSTSPSVVALEPRAFGSLKQANGQAGDLGTGESDGVALERSMPAGMGGDGDAAVSDRMMIAPYDPIVVEYQYEGEEFTLPENVLVYRMQPSASVLNAPESLIGAFHGLLNWSTFPNRKVSSANLTQGKNGYSFYLSYADGSLTINKEINYSARPESRCTDEDCFRQHRLDKSDMWSDERLISAANDFLATHGIDASEYGDPVVQNDWQFWLMRADNPADYYFPESLTVVYPRLINGEPVYEEYGQPAGMNVTVDMREKAVTGLYGLQLMDLQTSQYAGVDSSQKILDYAKRGGTSYYYDPGDQATRVTATLGTPTQAFVRLYKYDQEAQQSQQLYVPALVFPVTNMPEEARDNRQNVVVPLADELLQEPTQVMPVEPLMEPAVSEPAIEE